jgi:multimeric flavodoxin WrbA
MVKILAIAGSYREGGVIDQAVDVAVQAVREAGAEVDVVQLRELPIAFCTNCRICTQSAGEAPGDCVQRDGMLELVAKIESADAFILASPTNFYAVTALFKRFMERLVVYAYWPWGARAPRYRKKRSSKPALLITSAAAPAMIGRLFYSSMKELEATAKTIGAKPVGDLFLGLAAGTAAPRLSARQMWRIVRAAQCLV